MAIHSRFCSHGKEARGREGQREREGEEMGFQSRLTNDNEDSALNEEDRGS